MTGTLIAPVIPSPAAAAGRPARPPATARMLPHRLPRLAKAQAEAEKGGVSAVIRILPADGHETGVVAITERERFPVSPAVDLLPITVAS